MVTIGGRTSAVLRARAHSPLSDTNVLGTDFFSTHNVSMVQNYSKNRVDLFFSELDYQNFLL